MFRKLVHKTTGKIHQYKKWQRLLNDHLNNMGDYYWGATTASANQNKDDYAEVVDNLDVCLQKIEDLIDSCSQEARNPATQGMPKLVCYACNDGEVPYNCEPHHKYTDLCEDLSGPRIECDFDVLKSRVRSLSAEVIPIADLPNNGQMATMTHLSQHNPGVVLGSTFNSICALGGMSGELASTNEKPEQKWVKKNTYKPGRWLLLFASHWW